MSAIEHFSFDDYDRDYWENTSNYDRVVLGWRELERLGPIEDGVTVYGLTLTGSDLRDFFLGDGGADTLFGGGGDDLLYGGHEDDTIHGGRGNDLVDGGGGDDFLYGDAGDDIMNGSWGDDFLYGGTGNDIMEGSWGEDYLYGGDGDDRMKGGGNLYGGDGDDTLVGGWGDDIIEGGSGDDTIRGGPGNDIFVYATRSFGKDVIERLDVGEDKLDFRGSGLSFSDLKVSVVSGRLLVDAGAGNQIELVSIGGVRNTRFEDVIRSVSLFDPVPTSQTVPLVVPEVSIGDVSVVEGATASLTVELSEASGRDVTVYFSTADGTAGSGDYSGVGQPQEITFKAGEVSKVIEIGTTDDADHEAGVETFTVTLSNPEGATLGSKHTATVTIADDDASPVVEPPESETVPVDVEPESEDPLPLGTDDTLPQSNTEPENAPLSRAAVAGTPAADTMDGTSGADALDGLAGNDTAQGLGGDDRLWGRQGADTLYGNAGSDRLWGGRDGDELHGGVGKDHLYGGLGHDTLYGGRGDDTLHGGRLADRLHGGEGKDVLVGGHGRDRFVYDDADFGRDRIVDFEDGLDRLDFTGSGLRWGDLSVSNNGKGDAVVRVDGANSKIVLEGVDASLIDQNDFIF